ncbi:hypothetical protein QBC41DRAFT_24390 [Cercophora samala]|uniref:WW domain-containing protein n=1 Tax=Cercophora samala TaxID=330535 RepID=A0AA40DD56_9PEZI|nr:hypothetical protein QBC41DRAFT_24390 [Cercophora samala]
MTSHSHHVRSAARAQLASSSSCSPTPSPAFHPLNPPHRRFTIFTSQYHWCLLAYLVPSFRLWRESILISTPLSSLTSAIMSVSASPSISTKTERGSPPPTYSEVLQSSRSSNNKTDSAVSGGTSTSTGVQQRNSIPLQARRSMEDELRPVPYGWVREYDPDGEHQFFVDTNYNPSPRSIWHHPHDDDEFVSSLDEAEKNTLQLQISEYGSVDNLSDETTDDSGSDSRASDGLAKRSLARKLKDTLTGTTHDQRVSARAERAVAEKEMYRQHRILRKGMTTAMHTCRPAFLGKDENRTHMFLEAPGHTFPGVADAKPLSPYLDEIIYDESEYGYSKPKGRYLRPGSKMYGLGYGGYGCGKFAGGRWSKPEEEYKGRGSKRSWSLAMPVLAGMTMGGLGGIC